MEQPLQFPISGMLPEPADHLADQIRQFSQEVRLDGTRGRLDWIAGAFYSHDNVEVFTPGDHRDLFNTTTVIEADQDTDASALFVHGDWRLTERVKLITAPLAVG